MDSQRLRQAILAVIIPVDRCAGEVIHARIDPYNIIRDEVNQMIWKMVDDGTLNWRIDRDFELSVKARTTA